MRINFLIVILGVLSSFVFAAPKCEFTDSTNQNFTVTKPYRKIISLSPDLTELLYSIHAEKKIIGVVRGTDFPSSAKNLDVVADYSHINIEAILNKQPDLIIVRKNYFANEVNKLKLLGFKFFVADTKRVSDIANLLGELSCLTGQTLADENSNSFLVQFKALSSAHAKQNKQDVFFLLWKSPITTLNDDNWVSQIINKCGGRNIFGRSWFAAPQISFEALLMADPKVIISTIHLKDIQNDPLWQKLSAVKNHKIFYIDPSLLERASLRVLDGMRQVCQDIDSV